MIIAKPVPPQTSSAKPLVMLVDDDEDIRLTLCEILERLEFDVCVAVHGLDALTQLRAGVRPDVIVLDLMMPVMDGFELGLELRKTPALASIPVLVISAAGNARVEAANIAAAGHIQKPFKAEELTAAIHRVLKPSA